MSRFGKRDRLGNITIIQRHSARRCSSAGGSQGYPDAGTSCVPLVFNLNSGGEVDLPPSATLLGTRHVTDRVPKTASHIRFSSHRLLSNQAEVANCRVDTHMERH